jgi:hypothetical protein
MEGVTMVGDRVFALSEGPIQTDLIELAWNDNGNTTALVVQGRWNIGDLSQAEAMTFVPYGNNDTEDGRLYMAIDGMIHAYAVPDRSENGGQMLQRLNSLNMNMFNRGLIGDTKIAALYHFEGVTFILYDNLGLIRGWDLESGELLSEIPLPRVDGPFGNQWEGLALERRLPTLSDAKGSLRRGTLQEASLPSVLLVHLALDTPAQLWTFVVKETSRGSFDFPSCAGA